MGRIMRDPRTPQLTTANGWKMSGEELKAALGLPPKLGPAPAVPKFVGIVQGLEIWDCPAATNDRQKQNRPHRLHVWLDGRFVPAGRLHQYRMKNV